MSDNDREHAPIMARLEELEMEEAGSTSEEEKDDDNLVAVALKGVLNMLKRRRCEHVDVVQTMAKTYGNMVLHEVLEVVKDTVGDIMAEWLVKFG
jgi:hypothetical protein